MKERTIYQAFSTSLLLILFMVLQVQAVERKVTASDFSTDDRFGTSVAISGNVAVSGSPLDDDKGSDSGSAYFYSRSGTVWTQLVKRTASDGAASDWFGYSISIDGDYAVVGAPFHDNGGSNAGAAYLFYRNQGGTDNWGQIKILQASDAAAGDLFGWSVAISGDYVVVGAPYDDDGGDKSGSAYIYYRNQGGTDAWGQQAKVVASDAFIDDRFAWSVAIDGDYVISGAYLDDFGSDDAAGAAYVFLRSGSSWSQQAKLVASTRQGDDEFGKSVAIRDSFAVIGAPESGLRTGEAFVFLRQGTSWSQEANLVPNDSATGNRFGSDVGIDGFVVVIGDSANDANGSASGAAYSFYRTGSSWNQVSKITASDGAAGDHFGGAVAVSGDYAIAGARFATVSSSSNAGAAYINRLNVFVNIQAFLEGPYVSADDSMKTGLYDNSLLPLNQPFNTSPWNYAGSESVASIPDHTVDWVLVELRTGTASTTKIASRAAFLKNDGSIADTNGTSEVKFPGLLPTDYYVVVRHKNHLAVMTADSISLSSESSTLYNFTTAQTQGYGTNPMVDLGNGKYGFLSGDGQADGDVDASDINLVWRPQNGTSWSYSKYGDYDLDGDIDASDINLQWRPNNGSSTKVP